VIHTSFTERGLRVDLGFFREAYLREGDHFRRRLQDEHISVSNVDRVDALARSVGLPLPLAEARIIANYVDSVIRQPYPDLHVGVEDFLLGAKERGAFVCLVSNTGWLSGNAIRTALQRHGMSRYIDRMVFSDSAGCAKPCKRIFESAIESFGCRPVECVHIGDTLVTDVEGALNAGLNAVHLSETEPPIAGAYRSFSDFKYIIQYLDETFEWVRHFGPSS
jgi:FMN phosphatase YigB (HAD superfamily)